MRVAYNHRKREFIECLFRLMIKHKALVEEGRDAEIQELSNQKQELRQAVEDFEPDFYNEMFTWSDIVEGAKKKYGKPYAT